MPKLIDRDGERAGDPWITYAGDAHSIPAGACVILPLTEFREFAGTWKNHAKALGLVLSPSDNLELIANDLDKLRLIAIDFPSFTDGRGYSIAHSLRSRFGWRGELRAVGDIQRDQIYLLARSGFDTFALRDDQLAHECVTAVDDFTVAYQWGADRFGARRTPEVRYGA
jgi:uncharacterized protein (DUF934 family)